MTCRALALRMVKMCSKKEFSQRVKDMVDRTKMTTGETRKAAEADTTPEVVHPLANADA